ncbi:MAG TPA: ferrous iron transport protein A [Spirochaetia bacterium]|nr:MAG: hypothetical protein A2Y41_08990 [Spirochaetes bacterium GWB1_36_13]HCL56132.1 ferrous iron transport protein A [Spirochaetia bacterium]
MQAYLSDLKIGSKAVITGYIKESKYRHKILSMGLTRGTTVEVIHKAPLGDPIEIKLRGFHLSIRKNEAKEILIFYHEEIIEHQCLGCKQEKKGFMKRWGWGKRKCYSE